MATSYDKTKQLWNDIHENSRYSYNNAINERHNDLTNSLIERYSKYIEECDSLCELGMGSGRNIHLFHEKYPDMKYQGNDINRNIYNTINQLFPDLPSYTRIKIQDTLTFVTRMPKVDIIYTYCHLMHLPNDIIQEVCDEMCKKANMYMILYEAYPPLKPLSSSKQHKYDKYRFSRDYENLISNDSWTLLDTEITTHHKKKKLRYCKYLFLNCRKDD